MNNWNKNIHMHEFHSLSFNNFPNWDKINENEIPSVMLEIISKINRSSHEIATVFDDIAKGNLYYRDWTSNGLPFVNKEEVYHSRFWFQYFDDAKKFVNMFGGKSNWMNDFEEFLKSCNDKRNKKYEQ